MSILKAGFSRKETGVKTYQFILGSQITLRPKPENGIARKRKWHTNIFLEAKCPNFSKAHQQYIEREYVISAYLCSVAQLCPTLCDSMPCSPPGSSVHGILQARILEWVAICQCYPLNSFHPLLPLFVCPQAHSLCLGLFSLGGLILTQVLGNAPSHCSYWTKTTSLSFPWTQSRSRVGPSLQRQEEASVFGGWRVRERKADRGAFSSGFQGELHLRTRTVKIFSESRPWDLTCGICPKEGRENWLIVILQNPKLYDLKTNNYSSRKWETSFKFSC